MAPAAGALGVAWGDLPALLVAAVVSAVVAVGLTLCPFRTVRARS
ncbi:hypothetical protein [Terrabacter sp. NPDC080008]